MKLFVAAKGIISRGNDDVLIVKESDNYIDGTELGKWDVIGGRIDPEESLLEGLKREISEESGLKVAVGELLSVTEAFPVIHNEPCHIIRVYYCCVTEDDTVTLSSDHESYEWIKPNQYNEFNIMDDLHEVFAAYIKQI